MARESSRFIEGATLVVAVLALFLSYKAITITQKEQVDRKTREVNETIANVSIIGRLKAAENLALDVNTPLDKRVAIVQGFAEQISSMSPREKGEPYFGSTVPKAAYHAAASLQRVLESHPTTVDLNNVDLHGINWPGVAIEVAGSQMINIDLRAANLSDARIGSGVDLSDGDLRCADLSDAVLEGRLDRANLAHVNLSGADLRNAENLSPGKLKGVSYDLDTDRPREWSGNERAAVRSAASATRYHDNARCAGSHLRSQVARDATLGGAPQGPSPASAEAAEEAADSDTPTATMNTPRATPTQTR